jgi:hypothetical protein
MWHRPDGVYDGSWAMWQSRNAEGRMMLLIRARKAIEDTMLKACTMSGCAWEENCTYRHIAQPSRCSCCLDLLPRMEALYIAVPYVAALICGQPVEADAGRTKQGLQIPTSCWLLDLAYQQPIGR